MHDLKIKVTDFDFFCVKSLQCQLLQSLWLIWIVFGMNGYKILKCFRKEKRVSGELPCPATGLICLFVSFFLSFFLSFFDEMYICISLNYAVIKQVLSSKQCISFFLFIKIMGERGGSVVECRTPEREVGGSRPTAAVLCPWARHFTPRNYWLITQEAVAPSRHDWKIVD